MSDLIDRQAAIDAFLTELTKRERKNLLHTWSTVEVKYFVVDMLEKLPSAQPEIIRCKECNFWMPHSQFGYDEDNGTYHDYCAKLVPEDEYYAFYRNADDFCSRAERRTDEPDKQTD